MKILIPTLTLLACTCYAEPQIRAFNSVEELKKMCRSADPVEASYCVGVFQGTADYINSAQFYKTGKACWDTDLQTRSLIKIFLQFADTHEVEGKHAGSLVGAVIEGAMGCP